MQQYLSKIMNEVSKMKPSIDRINTELVNKNQKRALFLISFLNTDELNQTDRNGFAPIHAAARNGLNEVLYKLIDKKVNLEIEDKLGRTAIHHAVKSLDSASVITLANAGANLEHKDKQGRTPIDILGDAGSYGLKAQLQNKIKQRREEDFKKMIIEVRKRNLFLASQAF